MTFFKFRVLNMFNKSSQKYTKVYHTGYFRDSFLERMMDQHAPIASYIPPTSFRLNSSEHAQGENITSGLRLKNVRCTVLTREEAVDASRARVARGMDMNFWKGLLKQIAKCSLLTDGKREEILSPREREKEGENGTTSSGILYAFVSQIFGPSSPADVLAAGKPSLVTREKQILAGTSAANEILPLESNGMFVRNRDQLLDDLEIFVESRKFRKASLECIKTCANKLNEKKVFFKTNAYLFKQYSIGILFNISFFDIS